MTTEPTLYTGRGTPVTEEPLSLSQTVDALAAFVRRHWRAIGGMAVLFAAVATVATLARARTYTATASFMSQTGRTGSNLGGLAAQFGVALPSDAGGDSPQFYVDLITSREILDSVVAVPYVLPAPSGPRRLSLADVYHATEPTPAMRRAHTIRKLREDLAATIGKQTGVVNLAVTTPDPYLSQAVASQILDQINSFNLRKRQSRARAERAFTEERLASARGDLSIAENRLEGFMQENRQYRSSPRLSFDFDRLSRDVTTRQALVTTLTQAYEQARIDEVRNTPVITVLDSPEVPPNPDPRGLVTKIIFSVLLGALTGFTLAWLRERRRRA